MHHCTLPRANILRLVGVLSFLLFTLDSQALSISPSPSYDGNYVVSWSTALGCTYNNDPPFYSYQCASLYENGIEIASSGYSRSVTGKSAGSYQYRIDYVLYVYGQPYEAGTLEGPVSVTVGTPPARDPLTTQLTYQYETRAGDINWDGRTDIFIRRTSGGVAGNGTLEQVILRQNAGGTFSMLVPNSSQAATASAWPTSSASIVVNDFNVDGFVDVEVKGVAAAVGVGGALDQIVFSPAAFYQPQPLGLRAVDASLKQFVGNSLDFFFDEDYFTEYASINYFTAVYYWSTCGGGGVAGDVIVVDYSGSCFWVLQYVVGYYRDYTVFAGPAVAAWLAAESIKNGQVSPSTGMDDVEGAAESVFGVEIGGWPMEEELGATGEHTDPDIRRALEVFWAILGIGRANAQEVETDQAPPQTARSFDVVYITGHPVWHILPTHTALEYTSISVAQTTISAGPYPTPVIGPFLRSDINRPTDRFNMTLGTVSDPGNPIAALYFAELIEADSDYDDQLLYHAWNPGGSMYNSNGYTNGLIIATGGVPSINMNQFIGASHPVPASEF